MRIARPFLERRKRQAVTSEQGRSDVALQPAAELDRRDAQRRDRHRRQGVAAADLAERIARRGVLVDDQRADRPGLRRRFELRADAAGIDHPPPFEAEVAPRLEVGVVGEDDGDLARHVDPGIGVVAGLRVDDAEAGEDQRRVGDRRCAGIAQGQRGVAAEGERRPVEGQRRAGQPVEADERHVLIPAAMLARRLQPGGGELRR